MLKASKKSTLSVPIWIDSIKTDKEFKMTRFSYFVAEADEPIDDWTLILGRTDIPVIIYGLTVAICQPSGTKQRFESVDDLEALFDRLETINNISIETPDLWLPNDLFASAHTPKRGEVYRIGQQLFTAALRFRASRTTEAEFRDECRRAAKKPAYSALETKVFAEWSKSQVEMAKRNYEDTKRTGQFMKWE